MTETPYPPIELYDHEVDQISKIWGELRQKHQKSYRNYGQVENEIKGRFADAGFAVAVNWFSYTIDGKQGEGASPEVTIIGRLDKHQFDHDRQVREVTSNILDLPGQEGVIKTDGHGHQH